MEKVEVQLFRNGISDCKDTVLWSKSIKIFVIKRERHSRNIQIIPRQKDVIYCI